MTTRCCLRPPDLSQIVSCISYSHPWVIDQNVCKAVHIIICRAELQYSQSIDYLVHRFHWLFCLVLKLACCKLDSFLLEFCMWWSHADLVTLAVWWHVCAGSWSTRLVFCWLHCNEQTNLKRSRKRWWSYIQSSHVTELHLHTLRCLPKAKVRTHAHGKDHLRKLCICSTLQGFSLKILGWWWDGTLYKDLKLSSRHDRSSCPRLSYIAHRQIIWVWQCLIHNFDADKLWWLYNNPGKQLYIIAILTSMMQELPYHRLLNPSI